jgi:beta-lactamase superfamily II metal-dependent hydrolase
MCCVARTPSGKIIVIDCGTSTWRKSETVGEKLVAPYLKSLGAGAIDVAVLTHPHADHVSGYAGLLRSEPAKLVLDIGARHASPYYIKFLNAVKDCGASYRRAKRGQSLDMGDGVMLYVLSPDPAVTYHDLNNRSIVLRVVFKKVAFLLAADAQADAERHILASGDDVGAQVLQVGHHGSHAGTTPEWLAKVRPQVAVISCARHNEYGHPSREVTDRLRYSGIRYYRTDSDGAVSLTTDGTEIRIRTYRRR